MRSTTPQAVRERVIVFATFNDGKTREVQALLEGLPVRLLGPREVGVQGLPEETGETFLDNALLKAGAVFERTGLWSLSDDSGLEVAALNGAPGVHSARYGGVEHDDARNIARLLRELRGVEDRRAWFTCHAVLVLEADRRLESLDLPGGVRLIRAHEWLPRRAAAVLAVGRVEGRIVDQPAGQNGFGYDPVFFRDDLGRTFAELTREQKNALSHRGQALRALREFLRWYLDERT